MFARIQDIDISNLPARLLNTGCFGLGKSFYISRLLRKYEYTSNKLL